MSNILDISTFAGRNLFQQTGIPLYIQLATFMRRNIESGAWPVGLRLPSLEVLAGAFGIARVTVRQAVQLLAAENILSSKQGRGTFVANSPSRNKRANLKTSWQELIHRIQGSAVRIISEKEAHTCPPMPGHSLKLLSSYHYMKRLHSQGGTPYCFLEVYLATDIFLSAPDLLREHPVLTVLSELNIAVGKACQVLTIGSACTEAAEFLEIGPGAPVAHVHRFAEDTQGFTFYMAYLTYPGDYVCQEIDLLV